MAWRKKKSKPDKQEPAKKPEHFGDDQPDISFLTLYKFTTLKQRFFMLISLLLAAFQGSLFPLFAIIFGDATDSNAEMQKALNDYKECGYNCQACSDNGFYDGSCVCAGIGNCEWGQIFFNDKQWSL